MTDFDSRVALTQAIKQALAGEGASMRAKDIVSNPKLLSQIEKSAWLQLLNWSADEPLRSQYPNHAEFSRRRLSDLLKALED